MYLLDGHVHLHQEQKLPCLLDNFLENSRRLHGAGNNGDRPAGMILLAELEGQTLRSSMLELARKRQVLEGKSQWVLRHTGEPGSFSCIDSNGDIVYIVVGCQVNTTEKLELLLFGDRIDYRSEPLQRAVQKHSGPGRLVILPWGVGKWLGSRGRLVKECIEREEKGILYLGDNGNRPSVWFSVSQFNLARKKGIPVIRGTDPLFLPGEVRRVGSFGNCIKSHVNTEYPLLGLQQYLGQESAMMEEFGSLMSFFTFVRSQLQLRLCRRSC